jgi:hypothetical protein
MSTEDTITREELAAAISAIVGAQSFVCIGDAQEAASIIFAAAERIAEPEYEPGEIYQDPSGRAWFRLRLDGGWRCCESGTSYTGDVPERPLLKMTTGPVLATRVSRSEVIDTLGTFGMHEPARSGKIADYIMSLLRGEQP